jgi:hypothetical protein
VSFASNSEESGRASRTRSGGGWPSEERDWDEEPSGSSTQSSRRTPFCAGTDGSSPSTTTAASGADPGDRPQLTALQDGTAPLDPGRDRSGRDRSDGTARCSSKTERADHPSFGGYCTLQRHGVAGLV